ncbi:methyltransferase [Streptomyces krungchingensis]|uniref:methyltransferase n=1 Tax=Streptomyces TaxID=1883 RepID=UPI003CFA9893
MSRTIATPMEPSLQEPNTTGPAAAPTDPTPTPVALMELTTGFWRFKVLAAAVDLDLFSVLSRLGTADAKHLTAELGLHPRPARMLLACCTALGLLVREDGEYRNAPIAEAFLVASRPHYFGGFVQYSDRHGYPGWGRLQEALHTNRPTTWDPDRQESAFVTTDPEILASFWEAMFTLSSFTAEALAGAYDFTGHRRVLDVGGGTGAFPVGLCRRHPHLRATVLDLPHITAMAREKVAGLGMAGTIDTCDGDFLLEEPLPEGHDVIVLSMILHDWDETTGRRLLEKCWTALPDGGAVIICELVLDDDETGPVPAALMGLNMLIETRSGHNYTYGEYGRWLADAGFADTSVLPLNAAGANAAVVAYKRG